MLLSVADEEVVSRFVLHRIHVDKKGRIEPKAFWPPPDNRRVSVQRMAFTAGHRCRQLANQMTQGGSHPYEGLILIRVCHIRKAGARIRPWPQFGAIGHANIIYKHRLRKGTPAYEAILRISEYLKARALYIPDPDPQGKNVWQLPLNDVP